MSEENTEPRSPVLVTKPIVIVVATMRMDMAGIRELTKLIADRRPSCFDEGQVDSLGNSIDSNLSALLAHPIDATDNELLAELAGKGCYLAFGDHSSGKDTATYLNDTLHRDGIPHRSIAYHPQVSFYFAGISRRMLQELIRNYVGSNREVEGSPSVESTRYVMHSGRYVVHPRDMHLTEDQQLRDAALGDAHYLVYLESQIAAFKKSFGVEPRGMARKRIYEAASGRLSQSAETSLLWTTNPVAIEKLLWERGGDGSDAYPADLEFQRFAALLAKISLDRWPTLFSPKLHEEAAKWIAAWSA
jgi:thymidylate synthase ThyX